MSTVYLLVPITKSAENWISENLQIENWQKLGKNVGIEHRYIRDIVAGMQKDGLIVGEDFDVQN